MTTTQSLTSALQEKKLNKVAFDEITKWLTDKEFEEFVPELEQQIKAGNYEQLMDKFYRVVMFGTGGIRGKMDVGTNRINNYTIRWASQAFAQYILKYKSTLAQKGVAIAYDSRHHSQEFMRQTAQVLAANNIPAHIFDNCRATPELSFTVRHLGLAGGIVITASHNPPEFNGYKVYDENGVQVLPEAGLQIEEEFKTVAKINKMPFEDAQAKGLIKTISADVDKAFAQSAENVSTYPGRDVRIVFSPLHGVGSQSVLPVLRELGFKDIHLVEEQMNFDGDFSNVKGHFPNPELAPVYEKPIELAKKVNADIVIVSDPDADRLGIAIPDGKGDWMMLNGNQGAAVMGYFYLKSLKESGKLPAHPVVIKTSVTTDLVRDIAESFGAEVIGDLLVGFKFIGDRMQHLPSDKQFMFGCEESVGYLFSKDYRDKGADTPAVVAAEMAAWCKANGKTLIGMMDEINNTYGFYAERLFNRQIEGFGAFDQMNLAMKELRANLPREIGGRKIVKTIDRKTGEVRYGQTGELIETRAWDKGDMLSFFFSDDERNALHVRPSGTEPKMKYYTAIKGDLAAKTKDEIIEEAESIEQAMAKLFEDILKTIKVNVF